MSGTKAGGQAAAATNKKKYGKDFYARIGSKGGSLGHTGGFYANRELASKAGAIGGKNGRPYSVKSYHVPHSNPNDLCPGCK
jgi:general stress protein YciG